MGGEKMKTEAQKKATAKYDKKAYDVITVRIKKSEELKKHIQADAEEKNESINMYIVNAIKQRLEKNN